MNKAATASSGIDGHTPTSALRLHHAALNADGRPAARDAILAMTDEPGHQEMCNREPRAFQKAIHPEEDLTEHARGAFDVSRIVLAADESIRAGQTEILL